MQRTINRLMERIVQLMNNDNFKNKTKRSAQDFTRERKMGFVSILTLLLRMVRKSTQLELDEFREQIQSLFPTSGTYTKQSFSEARQKLLPKAFTWLNDEFIHGFYEDANVKTFRHFRLLAVDGSVAELPDTEETRDTNGIGIPKEKLR